MLKLDITTVVTFSNPECEKICISPLGVVFCFSGLRYLKIYTLKENKLIHEIKEEAVPYISINPQKTMNYYTYGPDRENWIICLRDVNETRRLENMRFVNDYQEVEIDSEFGKFTVPARTKLSPGEANYWKKQLPEIRKAWFLATPESLFMVHSKCMDIFRLIIRKSEQAGDYSPADKLKELIDQDLGFVENIKTLSKHCGFSAEHLRNLFVTRYGVTPKSYRKVARMNRIMEMITFSDLSIKEIATETGYRHLSNFCQDFKAFHGITPRSAVAEKRETDISTEFLIDQ